MKLSTRLVAVFGLFLLFLSAVLLLHVYLVDHLARAARELAQVNLKAATLSLEEIHDLDVLEEMVRKYALTRDPGYAARVRELSGDVTLRLRHLEGLPLSERERGAVAELAGAWRACPVAQVPEAVPGEVPAPMDLSEESLARVQSAARAVAAANQEAAALAAVRAEEAVRFAQRLSLSIALLAFLVSGAILAFTVRAVRRPLRRLTEATHAVAEGRFDVELPATGGAEFAALARDFNAMTARLSEVDQMKREMLSHVSHELKTPLAAMQETSRLLLDEVAGPVTEEQKRFLALHLESAGRLSRMIAKLLDLSRLEAGTVESAVRPHDAVPILRAAAEEVRLRAAERRVVLEVSVPDALRLSCDGDRLFQVLENLLENAAKFSPEGGVVSATAEIVRQVPKGARWTVRASGTGAYALFSVADRGPGIPPSKRQAVFERFHQEGHGRRAAGGVGLGLAICREIAKAHGGAVWAEENPGGGSLFRLVLPEAETEGRP